MDALNRKEAIIMGEDITPITREEYFVKELVNNGGGGGTEAATVSVTVGSGLLYAVAVLPHVEGMPEDYPVGLQSLTYSHATPDFGALTVPLYEGKCIWLSNLLEMSPAPTVTVTGDITYNETYGTFTIEGDGSITLE